MGARDPHRRVTLDDVARIAGVSRSTASRALADDPRISAPTRIAIRAAADELGYIPNAAARSLRVRRTRTLGLLLADLSDPVHGQVAAGFEQAAGERGYRVIFVAGFNDPVRERRALKIFTEHGTDGVALVSTVLDPREARARTRPDRLVVVQPDHRSLLRRGGVVPAGVIRTDDEAGVAAAVDHLVQRGYRDIGYVGGSGRPSDIVRREAAERALRARGIRHPMRRFEAGREGWCAPDAVTATIVRVLPEALICYDDKLALGLLDGLRRHGVSVPRDVGIVGFDGIPFAAISNPRLTTVATPSAELGRLAAASLVAAIHTGELPPGQILPVELVVGESTRTIGDDGRARPADLARVAVGAGSR